MMLQSEAVPNPLYFFDTLEQFGSSYALLTPERQVTYAELASCADQIAESVPARSLVFCLCQNQVASIVGYLGFLRKRIVPVLLSAQIRAEVLSELIDAYEPHFLWYPEHINLDMIAKHIIHQSDGYVLACRNSPLQVQFFRELAVLMTTSGSTGNPVFVRQSYQNIVSNTSSICSSLSLTQSDRPITTLPMHYTYGLSVLQTHLSQGASVVLNESSILEKPFWELARYYEVSSFAGVPYLYELLKRLNLRRVNLPSLRVMTQAGGAMRPEMVRYFAEVCAEKGIRFYCMYGQVEATARMACLSAEFALAKAGSIGKAIPGGCFWLEDEQGKVIDVSCVPGELCYAGPNVSLGEASGYADLQLADHHAGVLKTGDVAYRDEDGFYYIVGRKKRFVKLFGNRINLADVEELVCSRGYECACTGDDSVVRVHTTAPEEDHVVILRMLADSLLIHASAFRVIPIESLPRNEAGKILYAQLD